MGRKKNVTWEIITDTITFLSASVRYVWSLNLGLVSGATFQSITSPLMPDGSVFFITQRNKM